MKNLINFKLNLVNWRKRRKLTQKKLAELIQVSEPTMNHYESGKRSPTMETLFKLAEILECDPAHLVGDPATAESVSSSAPHSPENEFIYVPQYDIGPDTGVGIQSSQIVDHLAFKRAWVEQELKALPENLLLILCTGDAMEPTIRAGDLLLVDRAKTPRLQDGIYLLHIEDDLMIRRLERRTDGTLVIRGDNTAAAREEHLQPDRAKALNWVGRVVWMGRRL